MATPVLGEDSAGLDGGPPETAAAIAHLRESLFAEVRSSQERLLQNMDKSLGGIQRALERRTALLESRQGK
eukprot:7690820-Pyramimonas_sp.AAC.1